MAYLEYKKQKQQNIQSYLEKEILDVYGDGGYLSTTLSCCNTRKYHGLLIIPWANSRLVLLSSFDEQLVVDDSVYNLGLHYYDNGLDKSSIDYIDNTSYGSHYKMTYKLPHCTLKKEFICSTDKGYLTIKYHIEHVSKSFALRFYPFLAYRDINKLSVCNDRIDKSYTMQPQGITFKPYLEMPEIVFSCTKEWNYNHHPDWYYRVVYPVELERGEAGMEDLYVPGYFELQIDKAMSFSIKIKIEDSQKEEWKRAETKRANYIDCLMTAASQFLIANNHKIRIIAGYPWFGVWGRDTFISLSGLTLAGYYHPEICKAILSTQMEELSEGMVPNVGVGNVAAYNSVDASLWFIYSLQRYYERTSDRRFIQLMLPAIKNILYHYYKGNNGIKVDSNGLLWAKEAGKALTWMDAIIDGVAVTPRGGYAVEIQALWYNSICFYLEVVEDREEINFWNALKTKIDDHFFLMFWDQEHQRLADFVDEDGANYQIRPNQIIATALPYSLLRNNESQTIFNTVTKYLLTDKGLRTLDVQDPNYIGHYSGNQEMRDSAYHQGTIWPWLLSFYVATGYRLKGAKFKKEAQHILSGFEEEMNNYGIGTIGEIFEGDMPHRAVGTIAQAWSVAALLEIERYITLYHEH